MKKIILSICTLAIATAAFAGRPTGLRVGGGLSMDFYKSEVSGSVLPVIGGHDIDFGFDNTQFYGAYAEVGYDWNFAKHSTLCVGLRFNALFSGKADGKNFGGQNPNFIVNTQLAHRLYLDIPIMYQFAFNVSPAVQLFIAAGPTVNFWLTNWSNFTEVSSMQGKEELTTENINWFKNNNFYNRVNLSLGGALGVYFHHVKIYAGYDQSLIRFTNEGKSSRGQLHLGAAYVF